MYMYMWLKILENLIVNVIQKNLLNKTFNYTPIWYNQERVDVYLD